MKEKKERKKIEGFLLVGILFAIFLIGFVLAADPVYPDSVVYGDNETKNATTALTVNVSGGVISNFNISATIQNPRWKAFVGEVVGQFTLDDSGGSTIYDWTLATITGRVYATRKNTAVTWAGIDCATVPQIETENGNMNLNNVDDNITATFADTTHETFNVGSETIAADNCATLNTYRNGVKTQDSGQPFEEMVLYESGGNLVYATILEEDATGYNGDNYDFQMIVPEDATSEDNTIYYLYVELGN
jgi:hypothetical protein